MRRSVILITLLSCLSLISSLHAQLVVIDPGHGGPRDPGAAQLGVVEKAVNLDLAFALEKYLHGFGINTAMTRTVDKPLSLSARARYAGHFRQPTLFVSLHYNGAPRKSAHGIETFYHNAKSRKLAAAIQGELIRVTQAENRGVRRGNFAVIRKNQAPVSVLVEGGFLTNTLERRKVADPAYRKLQAAAIANGIARYLGKPEAAMIRFSTPREARIAALPMAPRPRHAVRPAPWAMIQH